MKKNPETQKKRKEFINLCIETPKKGAEILRQHALGLEGCRNSTDVLYALEEILFLSEYTILRNT